MIFLENEKNELKEKYIDDIKKEVIAFANTNGGTIYIGVSDDGNVIGLEDIDDINLKVTNSCRDSIKPDIMMFVKCEHLYIDGKKILAIHVEKGTRRPYYISSKGLKPSGVYVRQGTSSAPASESAIRQMIKESDGDSFENTRSMNQDLTFEETTKAFSKINLELKPINMKNLGMINEDNMYTNLALLLSDQCPHIIKAATFHGTEQEEFQDRKEFGGSLLKQLNDAYSYLDLRNKTKATFDGLYRIDSKDYPATAIRETLLNAIVHREYSMSANTLISIYDDRIEIVSFGGLAGDVILDDVLIGMSICRNPKLANIFYRLNLIESYGTGIKKINDSYKKASAKPEFIVSKNVFKVVLPNNNISTNKTNEQNLQYDEILNYIAKKEPVSRIDIEKHFQLSTSGALRLLNKLQKEKLISKTGKGKNVKYIILE